MCFISRSLQNWARLVSCSVAIATLKNFAPHLVQLNKHVISISTRKVNSGNFCRAFFYFCFLGNVRI